MESPQLLQPSLSSFQILTRHCPETLAATFPQGEPGRLPTKGCVPRLAVVRACLLILSGLGICGVHGMVPRDMTGNGQNIVGRGCVLVCLLAPLHFGRLCMQRQGPFRQPLLYHRDTPDQKQKFSIPKFASRFRYKNMPVRGLTQCLSSAGPLT